ncbi:MAG: hypothetical protein ACTHKL_14885, partial [Streptosporangiaceae bacterium]
RGQTNFLRMLWRFNRVYNGTRQFADHQREVQYELPLPERRGDGAVPGRTDLYIHTRQGRQVPTS